VASAAYASANRTANRKDHADEQRDDADAPEGRELRVHDGDEQQDDAENRSCGSPDLRGVRTGMSKDGQGRESRGLGCGSHGSYRHRSN
jgi:hypothetical protein